MTSTHPAPLTHDPIEASLSPADDRVLLNNWLPPKVGVVPKIRIGKRWINVLWSLPVGFVLIVIGVAVAQALRELPVVQDFLVRYPGVPPSARAVTTGFPAWLRVQHFLNLLFMAFSSARWYQVLADHPRLYWKPFVHGPGSAFRSRSNRAVDREGRLGDLAGLAGHLAFGTPLGWLGGGIPRLLWMSMALSYALLFWTGQWLRLVRHMGECSEAASTALQHHRSPSPPMKAGPATLRSLALHYRIRCHTRVHPHGLWGLRSQIDSAGLASIEPPTVARSLLAMWWFLLFILSDLGVHHRAGQSEHDVRRVNDGSWSRFAVSSCNGVGSRDLVVSSPFTVRHARVVRESARS
jgi:hypothetical protein